MKNPIIIRIIPALLLASSAFAQSEVKKEVIVRHHAHGDQPDTDQVLEKENVAFLGVETLPVGRTVAAQLGLPRDTGLVVRRVSEGSPAASVLQEHDVLTKLDDQILIDMHQLSVLVRSHKAGDEVKLTLVRGGKETTVKAKLTEHEVPKLAGDFNFTMPGFGDGANGNMFFMRGGLAGGSELAGPEAGDVMRMIGGDRMRWFAQPRVHVFKREGGKGATVLDLPAGNFSFSDDAGSVELNNTDGKRELTVKDKKGAVTFHGPLNTPEDHKKLPPEVVARLDAIGGADLDDDDGGLEVETKVLAPTTKTKRALPALPESADGLRTL
ncbi:MAG: PDZ domain-containing protein [Lacunisphaera sp.]